MTELSEKRLRAALLLTQGQSTGAVAAEVGVSRTALYNWRHDPAFREELERLRVAMWEESIRSLKDLAGRAVQVLGEGLSSDDEKVRLATAARIIELGQKMSLPPLPPVSFCPSEEMKEKLRAIEADEARIAEIKQTMDNGLSLRVR